MPRHLGSLYLAIAESRGCAALDGRAWKWSFALLNAGMLGMAGALLVAGIDQAFYERAIGGSTSGFAARSADAAYLITFWSGNAAGVVSLWSALYRGPLERAAT